MFQRIFALFHRTKSSNSSVSCSAERYNELLQMEKSYTLLQQQIEESQHSLLYLTEKNSALIHQNQNLSASLSYIIQQNNRLSQLIVHLKEQCSAQDRELSLQEDIYHLLRERQNLQTQLEQIHNDFQKCSYCSSFQRSIDDLRDTKLNLECQIFRLEEEKDKHGYLLELDEELDTLTAQRDALLHELAELNMEKLFQEFSLYEPTYAFSTSSLYQSRLKEIRAQQKTMLIQQTAAVCRTNWTVNGSSRLGNKMVRENIQQMLLAFNIECENAISNTNFSNWQSMKKRIVRAFQKLNQLNSVNKISISQNYLDLKLEEFHLAYEYALKRQEEKELVRQERALARERARVEKELRQEQQRIEKQQQHYKNVLQQLEQLYAVSTDTEKKKAITEKMDALQHSIEKLETSLSSVLYRQANEKAGYVYVISNLGAFGPDVYKIGMTRRLNPQERIDELSGASVPFRFDIHALIFSEDAPKLEAALHKAFADKRVNAMNNRKEFFHVSLEEIERVVKENHDKTVDFRYEFYAQQYRETLRLRQFEQQQTAMPDI